MTMLPDTRSHGGAGSPWRTVLISGRPMLTETVGALVASHGDFLLVPDNGGAPDVDLVLLDTSGGEEKAMAAAQQFRRRHPAADLVLLVDDTADGDTLAGRTGARSWVSFDAAPERLMQALGADTRVADSDAHGSDAHEHDDRDSSDAAAPSAPEELQELTRRERQVLVLLTTGQRAEEIGDDLGISSNTVRTHIQNLMRKLGVTSRFEAIAIARQASRRQGRPPIALVPTAEPAAETAVVLCWSNALERAGLGRALQSAGITVVSEAHDAGAAVDAVVSSGARVAIIPADLPGDGLWACATIKAAGASTRIIVTSSGPDPAVLRAAVQAGADGYVAGPQCVDDLTDVITRVAAGEAVIPGSMLATLLRELIEGRRQEDVVLERFSRLTRRERRILALLGKGLDAEGIAAELYVSPHTARTHTQNILRKLEVHSRAEAVALVDEFDLLGRFGPIEED